MRRGRVAGRALCGVVFLVLAACGSTAQLSGAALTEPTAGLDGPVGQGASGVTPSNTLTSLQSSGDAGAGPEGRGGGGSGNANRVPTPASVTPDTRTITAPIKVGLLSFASAAESIGADNGQTFTVRRMEEALVQQLNASGGLAGRRIVPVYVTVKGSSNDFSADLQAACTTFTQDEQVAAVLGFLGIYNEGFEHCLAKAHVPHITGDILTGDTSNFAQFPLMLGAVAVDLDRRISLVLTRLQAAGHLGKDTRLGVVLETCPPEERAYSRTLKPLVKRLGMTLAATKRFSCLNGGSGVHEAASSAASSVLAFKTAGVNRVMYIAYDPSALLFFIKAADQQQYRPDYLVTSADFPQVLAANLSAQNLRQFKGVGWVPALDVSERPRTAAADRCLRPLARAGVRPQSALDYFSAEAVCDSLFLYRALLSSTRGDSKASKVLEAARALGSGFASVAVLSGSTDFRQRRDGAARAAVFTYNARCSCLAYSGSSFRS